MGGNYAQNGGGGVGGELSVFFHKENKPLILLGRILLLNKLREERNKEAERYMKKSKKNKEKFFILKIFSP